MSSRVYVDIATCKNGRGRYIDVRFEYSPDNVFRIRDVSGRKYEGSDVKDRHWHVPLDMTACRSLREQFGSALEIGPALREWAIGQKAMISRLTDLSLSESAHVGPLWDKLPALAKAIHLGPLGKHMTEEEREEGLKREGSYQAADVQFIVNSPAPLVGNEQGTGKTPTWIASVWEAGLERGNHLVVCPKTAVEGTWGPELRKWQADSGLTVEVFCPTDKRSERESELKRFADSCADVKWVVVNPAMIALRKTEGGPATIAAKGKDTMTACLCNASKGPHFHYDTPFPILHRVTWNTICVDEAHKGSIRNHRSITSISLNKLSLMPGGKRVALSGTPMKKHGGSDIWGILHWLRPDIFTSYWRFVDQFFEVNDNGYGKKVGELKRSREEAFWQMLAPFMLRRTKAEVAPWLPPKMYVHVDCVMTDKQAKQYRTMEEQGSIQLGEDVEVSTVGVLDQLTRLKQFANAYCEVNKAGEMIPIESCKVEAMLEKMEEAGMFDEGSTRKQLVFSQSRRMVEYVAKVLKDRGLKVNIISGKINKSAERTRIMHEFQEGATQVLVIVTTAGGVSLTLDAADEVHMLDEMWSPDEDAQAEDRAHRVSRIHQVTVFYYRTLGTIDDYISETKMDKATTHEFIMDVRRRILAKHRASR